MVLQLCNVGISLSLDLDPVISVEANVTHAGMFTPLRLATHRGNGGTKGVNCRWQMTIFKNFSADPQLVRLAGVCGIAARGRVHDIKVRFPFITMDERAVRNELSATRSF